MRVLNGILAELESNAEFYEGRLMRNWLGQIAINLQNISYYKFIDQKQTKLLNEYASLIATSLENYDKTRFDTIVQGMKDLIENLKED